MQRSLGTNYMVEVAYVGSQGRQMLLKGDPNQAPPVVGVTDSNVNRPMPRSRRRCARSARSQSTGTLDYNALLVKFQRRFANNFSFLNSYTYGKAIDLNSDNDGTVTLTNVYDPQLQPRAGRLRHHPHLLVELDLRAAVGAQQGLRRLAGRAAS